MYYRGAAAAIVVYDITNKESFNGAKSWVKELQRRGDPNVVIALAGNKADLQTKRRVSTEVSGVSYAIHLHAGRKHKNTPKKMVSSTWRRPPRMPPMSRIFFKR
mmetsp:Transcript_18972/g.61145  ORF Transcript_18972/g.61145 Transcript_18972/m.61145 type:complete len:104 (-) Transcript_18972:1012-1323(-)